jgi:outer membrane protein TolC
VLQQRPDVFAAQRQAEAAWADVAQADADLKPRLSLSGQITVVRSLGSSADGSLWSVGPVQISLPLLDGGRRQSLAGVSRVAQDEALSALQATVRTAVREVETALIDLHATAARQTDAAVATEGMAQVLQAAVQRQRAGLASLFELEDARRNALAARLALAELERDRVWAWIALFQALGGGWQANPDALAADLGLATPRN